MRYEVNAVIHVPVVFFAALHEHYCRKVAIAELLLLRGSKAAQSQMDISEGRCLGRPQGAIVVSLSEGFGSMRGRLLLHANKSKREMAIEANYPHEAQKSGELLKLSA